MRRKRLLSHRDITGEALHIWELINFANKPLVEDRTFTDCVLNGPAMVAFVANDHIEHCSLGEGDFDSILHEMPHVGVKQGIIGFVNCKFIRCKFRQLGIYGDKAFLDVIRHGTTVI